MGSQQQAAQPSAKKVAKTTQGSGALDGDVTGSVGSVTDDEDDDSSFADDDGSTSCSSSSKSCACCYCELFGHGGSGGVPGGGQTVAPTSKRYPEMRERLRQLLKEKKKSKPVKSVQQQRDWTRQWQEWIVGNLQLFCPGQAVSLTLLVKSGIGWQPNCRSLQSAPLAAWAHASVGQ